MFGFQRALRSLEAKRASQELKALYPIKVKFSKKAARIGSKFSTSLSVLQNVKSLSSCTDLFRQILGGLLRKSEL